LKEWVGQQVTCERLGDNPSDVGELVEVDAHGQWVLIRAAQSGEDVLIYTQSLARIELWKSTPLLLW
jgi:hypothetical protein